MLNILIQSQISDLKEVPPIFTVNVFFLFHSFIVLQIETITIVARSINLFQFD